MLELLRSDSTLMGTQKPSFKKRDNPVYISKHFILGKTNLMDISMFRQWRVSLPAVGYYFATWLHVFENERYQTDSREVSHMGDANTAQTFAERAWHFYSNHDFCLLKSISADYTLFLASYEGIVNFHRAFQWFSTRSDHASSEFMKPRPSRLVASQPQKTLQSFCTASRLLSADPPYGQKPHSQGLASSLHHCSSSQGNLMPTCTTHKKVAVVYPRLYAFASRANKTLWPPNIKQIVSARFFRAKTFIELQRSSWKLIGVHNANMLYLVAT